MNSLSNSFSLEKAVSSVKLSVEALPESKIQEISLDGTETYFKPLTMSENLCKMATKIDFLNEEDGDEDEEDDESKKSFQNQRWPWEGIRNHLQQALTEISVLTDVLTITQNKGPPKKDGAPNEGGKYMMFDQARKEVPPARLSLQLPAKKKGLNAAAEILLNGEKRLRNAGDEILPDLGYHFQLLKLRKYWRIRKVGSKVLGDLSYRTAGSDFWHAGNFEVVKTTADDTEPDDVPPPPFSFPHQQIYRAKQQSALKVIIGADLRGSTNIRFSIRRKWEAKIGDSHELSNFFQIHELVNPKDPEWHRTLSYAQSVLFCRELFNKLAKEAVQLKTSSTLTPFLVVGNKISTNLFPSTELSIELVSDSSQENVHKNMSRRTSRITTQSCDIFSLKLAAMKLLLNHHKKLFNIPAPHPATATFGLTKIQRKAPTRPFVLSQMHSITESESRSVVERLVVMAKHWELKRRVCEVIEMLGSSIQDPYMQAHWSTVGSPTETSVCIVIMSAGYEACSRTLVNMSVGTDNVKAVQKDGRAISLSSNLHHIRDYLLSLLCSHQLSTAQEVCNILGWTIQHFSLHSGIGPRTAFGSVGAIMAASPTGNSSISIRCWIERGRHSSAHDEHIRYEVHEQTVRSDLYESKVLNQRSQQHNLNSELSAIQDPKWLLVGGEWRQVDWMKLYGKHFIPKLESLLTFLKSDK